MVWQWRSLTTTMESAKFLKKSCDVGETSKIFTKILEQKVIKNSSENENKNHVQ